MYPYQTPAAQWRYSRVPAEPGVVEPRKEERCTVAVTAVGITMEIGVETASCHASPRHAHAETGDPLVVAVMCNQNKSPSGADVTNRRVGSTASLPLRIAMLTASSEITRPADRRSLIPEHKLCRQSGNFGAYVRVNRRICDTASEPLRRRLNRRRHGSDFAT